LGQSFGIIGRSTGVKLERRSPFVAAPEVAKFAAIKRKNDPYLLKINIDIILSFIIN
jgi:hypothetical protein